MFNLNLEPNHRLEVHMYLFAFLAPLSVTQWNKLVVVILFLSALANIGYFLLLSKSMKFNKYATTVSLVFLSVVIVSFFSILINRDYLVAEYLNSVIIGRMFTVTALVLNFFIFLLWISNANEQSVLRVLKIGLVITIVFILLGYWQVIGRLLGIPFFIETRDWMHGVPAALRAVVPSRVTSIAEEPNYLSPILMECLILTALLVKKPLYKNVLLVMTFFIIILSFSGGAYVNFFLLCSFVFLFTFLKTVLTGSTRASHFFILLVVALLSIAIVYVGTFLIDFIYYKMSNEASGASSRSQFMISFVQLIAESSYTQLIFGHGLGTMSVLDEFGMRSEDYLFRITNNYVLDMFWESGAVGVLLIFVFFVILFYPGIKYGFVSRYYFLGSLMVFQLLVTSTYRSEYFSTHFSWVVFMIICIYQLAGFKLSESNQNRKNH